MRIESSGRVYIVKLDTNDHEDMARLAMLLGTLIRSNPHPISTDNEPVVDVHRKGQKDHTKQ